jgi:hypothetical protein
MQKSKVFLPKKRKIILFRFRETQENGKRNNYSYFIRFNLFFLIFNDDSYITYHNIHI